MEPSAAVNVYVPCPILVAKFTMCGNATEYCPRCVALPVAEPLTDPNGGWSGVSVCEPSRLPRNGTGCGADGWLAVPEVSDDGPAGDGDELQALQSRATAIAETTNETFLFLMCESSIPFRRKLTAKRLTG